MSTATLKEDATNYQNKGVLNVCSENGLFQGNDTELFSISELIEIFLPQTTFDLLELVKQFRKQTVQSKALPLQISDSLSVLLY